MLDSNQVLVDGLADWRLLLRSWASSGDLAAAAEQVFPLATEPARFDALLDEWSAGEFGSLPPVVLLPSEEMQGAHGAYSESLQTIYLNIDWLQTADRQQLLAVLTEEFGHYLDSILNANDTPGDEGALLAALLLDQGLSVADQQMLAQENDLGFVRVDGEAVPVELSAVDQTAPLITSFRLANPTLDPLQPGGAFLSAELGFSDDLSGLQAATFVFKNQLTGTEESLLFDPYYNLFGNRLSGSLISSRRLDPYANSGLWLLERVEVVDRTGNLSRRSSADDDWFSFLAASGIADTSFEVTGQDTDTTPLALNGLTFDQEILNPAQPGGAYLTARLAFSDDLSGLSSASLIFKNEQTGQEISLNFESTLSSGNFRQGIAIASRRLDPYLSSGRWVLDRLETRDRAGNQQYLSRDSDDWLNLLGPSGIAGQSFELVNEQPDVEVARITGFTLSDVVYNPAQLGGAFLSAELEFEENLSGFQGAVFYFTNLETGQESSLLFDPSYNIKGGRLIGSSIASRRLDGNVADGIWVLDRLDLTDRAGNILQLSRRDEIWSDFLSQSGIAARDTSFEVQYQDPGVVPEGAADLLPPRVTGLQLAETSLDPSRPGGAFLTASLSFEDDLSGIETAELRFQNVDTEEVMFINFIEEASLVGSLTAGTIVGSRELDPFLQSGTWLLESLRLRDRVGNDFYLSNVMEGWDAFLADAGVSDTPSFAIANTQEDVTPLQVTGLQFAEAVLDPSRPGGAVLSATLSFQDDLSGFSRVDLGFVNQATGETLILDFQDGYGWSGTLLEGALTASRPLDPFTPSGVWELSFAELDDRAGNRVFKFAQDDDWDAFVAGAGLSQASFEIVNSQPDLLAPQVKSLRIFDDTLDVSQPGGAFLTVTLGYEDNLSGFTRADLWFVSERTGETLVFTLQGDIGVVGSLADGSIAASREFDRFTPSGLWRLESIDLVDRVGNRFSQSSQSEGWEAFLAESGIEDTTFEIINGATFDQPATAGAIGTVDGTLFEEGVTLVAPEIVGDPDGDALEPNYAYQWYRDDAPIEGATQSMYQVTSLGAGSYKVAITYADALGNVATVESPAQQVASANNGAASFAVAGLSVPGSPAVGETLTASVVEDDRDGQGELAYDWQLWGGSDWVSDATTPTYVVPTNAQGQQLRLVVAYVDEQGFAEEVINPVGTVPYASTSFVGTGGSALIGTPVDDSYDGTGVNNVFDGLAGFDRASRSADVPNLVVSGSVASSLIEATAISGSGRRTSVQSTVLDRLSNTESIRIVGGASANTINAGGASTSVFSRSAYGGTFVAFGDAGADVITGGSYRNWLAGGGLGPGVSSGVDTLIGTTNTANGAFDVFDLRDPSWLQTAYVGGGAADYARISNFNATTDKLVLAGGPQNYAFDLITSRSGGKNRAVDQFWQVTTVGGDLVAQVRGDLTAIQASTSVLYSSSEPGVIGLGF